MLFGNTIKRITDMEIYEKVGVVTVYNHTDNTVLPWKIKWNNRVYTTCDVEFHHLHREENDLFHVFGVTDGTVFFRLRLNSQTLQWVLEDTEEV